MNGMFAALRKKEAFPKANTSIGGHFQVKMAETPLQCLSFAFFINETISWR